MIGLDGTKWAAYFWFVGWDCLSLGIHASLSVPNIEIHIPFGFIRIGRQANKPRNSGWHFCRNINMGGSYL